MYSLFSVIAGLQRRKKKAKPRKPKKATWFDEQSVANLKQLCKACKLPLSGKKSDLVVRLMANEFAVEYSGNKRMGRMTYRLDDWSQVGNMKTLPELKSECQRRFLAQSGNKFELVLRIFQHENGTGGAKLKVAPTEVVKDASGNEVRVAKTRKPSKPSPKVFYNRIEKKIKSVDQKKYQSHWGSKAHGPAVTYLMEELMGKANALVDTEPKLAFECYHSVVTSFVDNFDFFRRPGYCEGLDDIAETMKNNVVKMRRHLSRELVQKLANAMLRWQNVCDPYCLMDNFNMHEAVDEMLGDESSSSSSSSASTSSAAATTASTATPAAPPAKSETATAAGKAMAKRKSPMQVSPVVHATSIDAGKTPLKSVASSATKAQQQKPVVSDFVAIKKVKLSTN